MYLAIDRESRNAVYVAIELGLICLTIGGCLAFLVGLRNADVWFSSAPAESSTVS